MDALVRLGDNKSYIADLQEQCRETWMIQYVGKSLAANLERCLMSIPLVAHEVLSTAYINDVDGYGVFAHQLLGFGRPG